MITENLSTLKIYKLTQEQYNQRLQDDTIDESALYLTPDEEMDLSGYATVEQVDTKADVSHTHSEATPEAAGFMSAADKIKLDNLEGGTTDITVDDTLNSTSTNPIQNQAVNAAIVNLNTLVGDEPVADQIANAITVKSDVEHNHEIVDITNLQSTLDVKVPTTRTVNGKALSEDITLSATDIGADVSGSADIALSDSKTYTDNAVAQKSQVQIITWEDDD